MNKPLIDKIQEFNDLQQFNIPATTDVECFVENCLNFMFPFRIRNTMSTYEEKTIELTELELQFINLLKAFSTYKEQQISEFSNSFIDSLSTIFDSLILDANAILEFDPAAKSLEEVIHAYPGFYAVSVYRLSHIIYQLKIPFFSRIISEYAHGKTGIDIHPGAKIGKSFFIDHGTGVVIGETTSIGDYVKIYQGVTLGALQVLKEEANIKRHPTIEDNVIIYSGATILGGETVIGHDTVIGGNVWLTESVPSFSLVFAQNQIKLRSSKKYIQAIDFVI